MLGSFLSNNIGDDVVADPVTVKTFQNPRVNRLADRILFPVRHQPGVGDLVLAAMNRLREFSEISNEAKWRLAAAYALAGQKEASERKKS